MEQEDTGTIDMTEETTRGLQTAMADAGEDEELDISPLFGYLRSPQGHEIMTRVVGLVEGIKKSTLDKNFSQAKFNRWMEAGVIVVVISAIVILSAINRLNPTVGVILGSVVGYFFGKSK